MCFDGWGGAVAQGHSRKNCQQVSQQAEGALSTWINAVMLRVSCEDVSASRCLVNTYLGHKLRSFFETNRIGQLGPPTPPSTHFGVCVLNTCL